MTLFSSSEGLTRRQVLQYTGAGLAMSQLGPLAKVAEAGRPKVSKLFSVDQIHKNPFKKKLLGDNHHIGVDCLLYLMAAEGLKFYRSRTDDPLCGRKGMIAVDDVVLLKVNAQWKYRGATNSDVVRGVIQAILDHPDGFTGEIVIFENGQGYGSLDCDVTTRYTNADVHANANREHHSFQYLIDTVFQDPRVSGYLLDPIRSITAAPGDHLTDGYRAIANVSYPCFTTAGGNRVELREGVWTGTTFKQNLKLINIPVLKHHDTGGSEFTASLKHTYGILSMSGPYYEYRHYSGLGETCGNMFSRVRTPVLNLLDAIWVSHASLAGHPRELTTRTNRLVAGQDPVALDYWAAKNILHPVSGNHRHHPDSEGVAAWLDDAAALINGRGGLWKPKRGIFVNRVTKDEEKMEVSEYSARQFLKDLRQARKDLEVA